MPRLRQQSERLRTSALLLRSVPVGEADLMLTLFTEARGLVSAMARSARKSSRRFSALEAIHTLRIELEEQTATGRMQVLETHIEQPRPGTLASLERIEAAGELLRWCRDLLPPEQAEPVLWRLVTTGLDAIDAADPLLAANRELETALAMLSAMGWQMEWQACVVCGRSCDATQRAFFDAARGGLVCSACGGARTLLEPEQRARLCSGQITATDHGFIRSVVEEVLRTHSR